MIYAETRRIQDNRHESWCYVISKYCRKLYAVVIVTKGRIGCYKGCSPFTNLYQTTNLDQTTTLPWEIRFKLLNRNTDNTTFRFKKRDKIGFSMTLNEGTEQFRPKYNRVSRGN